MTRSSHGLLPSPIPHDDVDHHKASVSLSVSDESHLTRTILTMRPDIMPNGSYYHGWHGLYTITQGPARTKCYTCALKSDV